MPLANWPKAPTIGLIVLLLLTRQWNAAPFIALALLILGLYFAVHYGEWRLFGYGASFRPMLPGLEA